VDQGNGVNEVDDLSPQDVAEERLIMGLRLQEGLYIDDVTDVLDWARVKSLCDDGYLWKSETQIGATEKGRPLLNYLISQAALA
jgi:oxygen-independent coproporphyrinogen-3 oxidase